MAEIIKSKTTNAVNQTSSAQKSSILRRIIFILLLSGGIISIMLGLFRLLFNPPLGIGSLFIGTALTIIAWGIIKSASWIPIAVTAFLILESIPEISHAFNIYTTLPPNDLRRDGLIPAFIIANGLKIAVIMFVWFLFRRRKLTS